MDTPAAALTPRTARQTTRRTSRGQSRVTEGWRAREYLDDGIAHVEIRDRSGCLQVIIANAAELYWALPIGFPTARVSLPNWRLKLPEGCTSAEVYECSNFILMRYSNGKDVLWFIQPR
ncbi:hypothetical protein [uncultured Stenotrophomonas sp.]|uniref:hypothetical protein n=1 Tax=uncultured Stenotrophomonas sp. TaxID=165438 RepID=UPI0028E639CA|nr:hypothetical protein [uncultured Stenotrophomonas sp.]